MMLYSQKQARVPVRYEPGRCLAQKYPMHIVLQVHNMDFLAAATHGTFMAHAEDTQPV